MAHALPPADVVKQKPRRGRPPGRKTKRVEALTKPPEELKVVFGTAFWRDFVESWQTVGPGVLRRLAASNPAAYAQLASKVLPQQLELMGRGGGPLLVQWLDPGAEDNTPPARTGAP